MRTGASGVCSMGGFTSECNSAELRFWYGDEQLFKDNLKYCIANNIYAICNLDFHKWGGHYPFSLYRLNDMLTIMAECGATKSNSRITVENEPMKYWSREEYCDMVNQVYAVVAGRYYVGANNEEFGLGGARDLYPYLFEHAEFDYFDIHIQSTMIQPGTWRVDFESVRNWLAQSRTWCETYDKKLSCTEANWSRIETSKGHMDLMQERDFAKTYGCEDFNIVFIKCSMDKYSWLNYDNSIYWDALRQEMLDEKKEIEEDDDMKLELLGLEYQTEGQQVKWLQDILLNDYKVPNSGGIDGVLGSITDQQIRDYQEEKEIKIDGICGENTTMKLINESSDPRKWYRNLQIYMAYE